MLPQMSVRLVEEQSACFVVRDHNGQRYGYPIDLTGSFYCDAGHRGASPNLLTQVGSGFIKR
jgi:hypothetical protein